jgi:hypothetical protein
VSAVKNALMTTPPSTSERRDSSRSPEPRLQTATIARRPKTKARGITANRPSKNRIATAPPNPAPEETPMICGPTRGLRKTP